MRFNPRTREGCDFGSPYIGLSPRVSIHAPVKGATQKVLQDVLEGKPVSIHAPVKGATYNRLVELIEDEFQSTHP